MSLSESGPEFLHRAARTRDAHRARVGPIEADDPVLARLFASQMITEILRHLQRGGGHRDHAGRRKALRSAVDTRSCPSAPACTYASLYNLNLSSPTSLSRSVAATGNP